MHNPNEDGRQVETTGRNEHRRFSSSGDDVSPETPPAANSSFKSDYSPKSKDRIHGIMAMKQYAIASANKFLDMEQRDHNGGMFPSGKNDTFRSDESFHRSSDQLLPKQDRRQYVDPADFARDPKGGISPSGKNDSFRSDASHKSSDQLLVWTERKQYVDPGEIERAASIRSSLLTSPPLGTPRRPSHPLGSKDNAESDLGARDSANQVEENSQISPLQSRPQDSLAIEFARLTIDKKRIGKGGKGDVHSGLLDGTQKVAIKKVDVDSKQQHEEIMQEARILTGLDHEYVVRMYGIAQFASFRQSVPETHRYTKSSPGHHRQTKSSPGVVNEFANLRRHQRLGSVAHLPSKTTSMYIVMELCDSSLKEMLQAPESDSDFDKHALEISLQVAEAMAYLHDQGVCHRDLKPGNILLLHGNVRLADFGLSKNVLETRKTATLEIGTPAYMPPELFVDIEGTDGSLPPPRSKVDPYKSDVYAFAIILWALFHRRMPYENLSAFSIVYKVKMEGVRPLIDPQASTDIRSLLNDCWQMDQSKRPDFKKIFARLNDIKSNGDWFLRDAR